MFLICVGGKREDYGGNLSCRYRLISIKETTWINKNALILERLEKYDKQMTN